MTPKSLLTCLLVLVITLVNITLAAVFSLPDESHHHSHNQHDDHHHHYDDHHEDHNHHVSVANSYMHFHGPVEGPEFEVKVPYFIPHHTEHHHLSDHDNHKHEEHNSLGYVLDYVAHPKYEFSYGVEDYHTGDFHGQKEVRDGDGVTGEYTIQEPGGVVRVVKYKADKSGFHAVVHNTGKNDHSGGTYSVHAQPHAYSYHSKGLDENDNGHFHHGLGHEEHH